MKRFALRLFAGFLLTLGLVALSLAAGVEDEVRAMDDKRHQGLSTNDVDAWLAVMSDDIVYIHSSGIMDIGKEALAAPFRKGEVRIKNFAREVIKVRTLGDTVQVIGKGSPTVVRGNEEQTFSLLYTSTWRKLDGGWKMVHWQATRLPTK